MRKSVRVVETGTLTHTDALLGRRVLPQLNEHIFPGWWSPRSTLLHWSAGRQMIRWSCPEQRRYNNLLLRQRLHNLLHQISAGSRIQQFAVGRQSSTNAFERKQVRTGRIGQGVSAW